MSFAVTQLVGFGARQRPAVDATISYRTNPSSETDSTTYTFSGTDIGTASATRYVVVGVVHHRGAGVTSTSSVTVGGSGAASVVSQNGSSASNASLWIVAVPSGTTADIVVTVAATADRVGCGVWALYDLDSSTAHATSGSSASPGNLNLNWPANGVGVAIAATFASGESVSWTGMTERWDGAIGSFHTYSGASSTSTTAETPRTVTATYSSTNIPCAVAATWT